MLSISAAERAGVAVSGAVQQLCRLGWRIAARVAVLFRKILMTWPWVRIFNAIGIFARPIFPGG
jgi:hypothetical protein